MKTKTENKVGGVLILVMVLVLMMGALGAGLMQLGSGSSLETSHAVLDARAFWVAEAGLNHAKVLLQTDSGYQMNPTSLVMNGYAVRVEMTNISEYIVTSTGTVVSAVRVVQQKFGISDSMAATNYGIFSDGELKLSKDTDISGVGSSTGNVYAAEGYSSGSKTPDYLDGGTSTSSNDYPAGTAPRLPVLNTNLYNQLIAQAVSSGAATFNYQLSNPTNYYHIGNLTITGQVSGVGVMVVSGNVNFTGKGRIASNVQLISGSSIGINTTNACLGSNDFLYAATSITLDPPQGDDKVVLTNGACALVTPGNINAQKDLTFWGIMYAGGTIYFDKTATIVGSLIAGGDLTMKMDTSVTYDSGQFSTSFSGAFVPSIELKELPWWREIPTTK
jgi:Tfp pilus assembly protein PilX